METTKELPMRRLSLVFLPLSLLALVPSAAAQCGTTFSEGFGAGSNEGGWGFGHPGEQTWELGGNPGAFFGNPAMDTFTPRGRTKLGVASVFHGDYRAAGVSSLGIDFWTFSNTFFNSCMRPVSVQLISDPGTPGNIFDDTYVYFVTGAQAPCPGEDWKSYDVDVLSASTRLPAGWGVDPENPDPADQIWNEVIQDVDQVMWWYGNPTYQFVFEIWGAGLDNPRVTFGATPVTYCTAGASANGCQATLSASGTPSASAASGFDLLAANVEGDKDGLFFYGANGRQASSWGNGTSFQCVTPPVRRAGLLTGSGSAGLCDGTFAQDLNARWAAVPAHNPGAGSVVQAQLWYRDPFNTSNQTTSLSEAIEFCLEP
jgi:hypothetical protein